MKTIFNPTISPCLGEIFETHSAQFERWPLWVKGGGARDALIATLRGTPAARLRDLDLVLVGDHHTPEDVAQILVEFDGLVEADGIEVIQSVESHFDTLDFTINGALVRPGEMVATEQAVESVQSEILTVSDYEMGRRWGLQSRLGLRALLFSARLNMKLDPRQEDEVSYAATAASDFLILIHLFKAMETGVGIAFVQAMQEAKILGLPSSDDAQCLLGLLKAVGDFELRSSSHKAIVAQARREALLDDINVVAAEQAFDRALYGARF